MTTEFINKLIAAGFDVQTQNHGTTVTVSYTQTGSSLDSNLKEIEEKFKLVNGDNTPVDFYSGVTTLIKEAQTNPNVAEIIRDHTHGESNDAVIAGDCDYIATSLRSGADANNVITIGSREWFIAGRNNEYRLTINPDSTISIDEMLRVREALNAHLGEPWIVVFVNRVHGIEIIKPDYHAMFFTNLINALPHYESLSFTIFGTKWTLCQRDEKYLFQPSQLSTLEPGGVVDAVHTAIQRELESSGLYEVGLICTPLGPCIDVVKKESTK